MAKEEPPLSSLDMVTFLSDSLINQAFAPNMYAYVPHGKQQEFHSCAKRGRLFLGGNRSGKSVGGVLEDIKWLTKTHEHRTMPGEPVRGRVVVSDFVSGWQQILQPIFA